MKCLITLPSITWKMKVTFAVQAMVPFVPVLTLRISTIFPHLWCKRTLHVMKALETTLAIILLFSPYGSIYEEDGTTLKYYPRAISNHPLVTPAYTAKRNDIENLNASIYMKINLPLGFSIQMTLYLSTFWMTNYLYQKSADHPSAGSQNGRAERKQTKDFTGSGIICWNGTKFLANTLRLQFSLPTGKIPTLARRDDSMKTSNQLMTWVVLVSVPLQIESNDIAPAMPIWDVYTMYTINYSITATVRKNDGYSAFGL